jgi:ectoine hydroxylase-related dioxygenase (phytanoyl-CoA dioxygenase family)
MWPWRRREAKAATKAKHHSKYGGLWIDREDWQDVLAGKGFSRPLADDIARFVADGYVIFEGAASLDAVEAFQRELERSFREGNSALLYQYEGDQRSRPLDGPVPRLGTRVVDAFAAAPQALDLFASPRLIAFLNAIFGEDPLLFQSLSFDQGSQQGLHQDTAYVVVNRPLELAACWIALEDVKPGSGELIYVPGSHRLEDWTFGPGRKHWNPEADGDAPHDAWSAHLRKAADELGAARFLAKKGDILIWHADLAHGGSPVTDPALTRQSLVGHFCPQSAAPNYFGGAAERRTVMRHGRLAYSSEHYDLRAVAQKRA